MLVVEVVHPAVHWFASLANDTVGTVLVCICAAALVADITVTVLQALKLNKKLKEIDGAAKAMRLGSDVIGKGIADATLAVEDKLEQAKQKSDAAIDAIVKKMPKRLLKAFPSLSSRVYPDSIPLANDSIKRIALFKKRKNAQAKNKKK